PTSLQGSPAGLLPRNRWTGARADRLPVQPSRPLRPSAKPPKSTGRPTPTSGGADTTNTKTRSSRGVSFEMAVVAVDQRTGELLLQVDELKPVRLELVATRLPLVQGLALYDELTDRSL